MKQFAIIGVDSFAKSLLEELMSADCEILLIDKDREIIDHYKDDVTEAYVADVMNEEAINRLIPTDIDGVIVDLGGNIEASLLVANYLKKMGLGNIHVKVDSVRHGEILEIIGAVNIIYPDREAARRLTPMLLTSSLFNFVPIGNGLVMAEVSPPPGMLDQQNDDVRRTYGINIIAYRSSEGEYNFYRREHIFSAADILLVVGPEEDIVRFTEKELPSVSSRIPYLLRRLFKEHR